MSTIAASRRLTAPVLVILALVGVGSLAYRSGAHFSSSAPKAAPIVATVDVERLVNECEETKKRNAANEARYKPNFEGLKTLESQIDSLKKELKSLPADNKAARRQLMLKGSELEGKLKAQSEFLRSALDEEKASVLGDVYTKALQVIQNYSAANGIALVLADDSTLEVPPEGGSNAVVDVILRRRVLFADKKALDITSDVIAIMNNDFAATGGKAPKK